MAEKGFGVKDINLIGPSGTPTITSPNNLNLNANNVAISTNVSIGGTLSVTGNISVGGTLTYEDVTNIDSVGVITARSGVDVDDFISVGSNIHLGNAGVVTATTFSGSAASLTSIPAANITGTLPSISGANLTGITITPTNSDIQVAYTVTANGSSAYRFAGNGVVSSADNPDLYLIRGQKYRFINNSGGSHPFQIREASGGTAYSTGVTNNGAASGNIDFAPTYDSPAQLVYQCTSHGSMVGNIYLRDAAGNNTNVGVVTATAFIPTQGQLSHRNIIVNGAMMVAQRGTSSTTANAYSTVDRVQIRTSGVDEAPTQAQVDVASGTTPFTLGFRKALRLTNGNQTSGAGTSDFIWWDYRLESQDMANSGWNYTSSSSFITFSFWIKSSVAQTFKGYFRAIDGTTQQYPFETGSLSADTWTKVTKTIPGNSNISFDNDSALGFQINIFAFYGTDVTDNSVTENAWSAFASSARMKDNTSTWYTTNDATLEMTGFQLEVGPVATPFEHRSFGEEKRRCQRYCVLKGGANGTYDAMATGAVWSTTVAFVPYFLPVEMRDTPSLTLVGSLSDFRFTRSGSEVTPNSLSFDQGGKSMCAVRLTSGSMTANDAVRLYNTNTNGGFLFTAEL